jgi:hypothetical protein
MRKAVTSPWAMGTTTAGCSDAAAGRRLAPVPRPNTLGLTRRDVRRIQAMAEACTDLYAAPALVDLDVPVRVIAVKPAEADRFSGEILGQWAGRTLLYWRMTNREIEAWRQRTGRPPG